MTRHHRPHLAALALCAAMAATVALPATTLAADAQALTTALATFGRANGGDSAAIDGGAHEEVHEECTGDHHGFVEADAVGGSPCAEGVNAQVARLRDGHGRRRWRDG